MARSKLNYITQHDKQFEWSGIRCKVSYSVPIEVKNKSEGNLLQNCAVGLEIIKL